MFEVLPEHIRKALLQYDFIEDFIEGKISKDEFNEKFNFIKDELKSKGVSINHILALYNCEDKDKFLRKAAHSRFVRACRNLGLDIATKQDKVRFLKSINTKNFLDLLHAGSGFLRGLFTFQGWNDRKEDKAIVSGFGGEIVELEPPEESYKEFEKFFALMQEEINERNIEIWAVKLYFAIISAHMFPDGNGRLGRNAYFLMKSDGLLDEKKSSERISEIARACFELYQYVGNELLKKEGISVSGDDRWEYAAGEDCELVIHPGESGIVKFVAAKRVLERIGEYHNQKYISLHKDHMSRKEKAEFGIEYQKVRIEWFWESINFSGKHYKHFAAMLDAIIQK